MQLAEALLKVRYNKQDKEVFIPGQMKGKEGRKITKLQMLLTP